MMPPTLHPRRCMMHGMDRQIPIMTKRKVMKMIMRVKAMIIMTIVIMSMNVRIGQASRPAHQSGRDSITLLFLGQTDRGMIPRGNI